MIAATIKRHEESGDPVAFIQVQMVTGETKLLGPLNVATGIGHSAQVELADGQYLEIKTFSR